MFKNKRKLVSWILVLLSVPILLVVWVLSMERYFFLWLLILILFLIFFYKLNSGRLMKIGLINFLISIFLTVINQMIMAEFLMRFSFVFWLAGLFLAMYEYLMDRKVKKLNRSGP